MKPWIAMWCLSFFEIIRAIFIVRKWSDDGDLDIAMFRMPLPEVIKLQVRLSCAIAMWITAQVMWWLP